MARRRPLEQHLLADQAQLEQREHIGDQLSTPRELEYFAYFGRRAKAEDAAAALEGAGFTVEYARSGLRTVLTARRLSDVLPATVERNTRLLFDLVEVAAGNTTGGAARSLRRASYSGRPGATSPVS
jgi:hypothetical protein